MSSRRRCARHGAPTYERREDTHTMARTRTSTIAPTRHSLGPWSSARRRRRGDIHRRRDPLIRGGSPRMSSSPGTGCSHERGTDKDTRRMTRRSARDTGGVTVGGNDGRSAGTRRAARKWEVLSGRFPAASSRGWTRADARRNPPATSPSPSRRSRRWSPARSSRYGVPRPSLRPSLRRSLR